jgi:hypothetical protein
MAENQIDPTFFLPQLQSETARIISNLLADLAVKNIVITQLQEKIKQLEEVPLTNALQVRETTKVDAR